MNFAWHIHLIINLTFSLAKYYLSQIIEISFIYIFLFNDIALRSLIGRNESENRIMHYYADSKLDFFFI